MSLSRALAALGALAGAVGLVLQAMLMLGDMESNGGSVLAVFWRFFGYFTLLTNTLVTLLWLRAVFDPVRNSEAVATSEAMGATAILFVGSVYHLLLAPRWDPQGLQLLADILLHSVTPILFALFWLARPHGQLKWRDAFICALWPLAYAAYALTRGAFDGWYAYYFMDPTQMSTPELIASISALSGAFVIGALILVALDKALGRRAKA
ncbi:MAG: Pr6Pr family membrane protein [Hyphomonadaceae bacterium]|nr:Pr6Pr family membrane protein [Hyphomonadaceae bacterium]